MRVHIDIEHLEALHRAELARAHRKVLRLVSQRATGPGVCWELGRLFKRITDGLLYKAAGHRSFEAYVTNQLKVPKRSANLYKAIAVFPRSAVEEFGISIFESILRYWAVRPGVEDPAHVRRFRFPVIVRGRVEEHALGSRVLTVDRLNDAAIRAKRAQVTAESPLAAFLTRFIDRLERGMRSVPDFSVETRQRKTGSSLRFSGIGDGQLVHFWRALGAALADTSLLSPAERACVLALRSRAPGTLSSG